MEDDLLLRESQSTKVLMIRQSIGQGAAGYVQQHLTDYERNVYTNLAHVLRQLLPKSSEDDLQKAVTKFVTKAIALKTALTEEQAMYRCYWATGGDRFDPESVEISDGEKGPVCLCTFPGLARMIQRNMGKSVVYTFKASAVLRDVLKN